MPDAWMRQIARRAAAGVGLIAVALAGLLVWSYHQRRTEVVRLAVLPFEAGSGGVAAATTITLSLSHRLALVRGMTVLPAMLGVGYRTSRDSAHAIARALGVRYLVVGRVDRSPTATAPDRITIDAWLVDTEDSPPTTGQTVSTVESDLCPAIAVIAIGIAGHFARAPRGRLWGPGGVTGCAAPRLLEQRDDMGA